MRIRSLLDHMPRLIAGVCFVAACFALQRCSDDDDGSTPLKITDVSPMKGEAGANVTISGSGFSKTLAANEVEFNGVTATISEATESKLVVVVPEGASTGKVSVTVGGKTAVSASDFVVETSAPVITSFTPTSGVAGAQITLNGINFGGSASENTVKFNGTSATIVNSTATSLTVVVPEGATSGKISVTVGGKTATSATDFIVELIPIITNFTPTSGLAGTEVILNGMNFSEITSDNVVKFNGELAEIVQATKTSLTVLVPESATSGKISVSITGKTGTSNSDFEVLAVENPFEEYLALTGFEQDGIMGGAPDPMELGLKIKPAVDGLITGVVIKHPVDAPDIRVTIWDVATESILETITVPNVAAGVETTHNITPLQLEHDKEYVVSFNTNAFYTYSRPDVQNATYPINAGNISISEFVFNFGANQTYPQNSDLHVYYGDLSFNFQYAK